MIIAELVFLHMIVEELAFLGMIVAQTERGLLSVDIKAFSHIGRTRWKTCLMLMLKISTNLLNSVDHICLNRWGVTCTREWESGKRERRKGEQAQAVAPRPRISETWCSCGGGVQMDTEEGNLCRKEWDIIQPYVSQDSTQCVTHAEAFPHLIHPAVLQMFFFFLLNPLIQFIWIVHFVIQSYTGDSFVGLLTCYTPMC